MRAAPLLLALLLAGCAPGALPGLRPTLMPASAADQARRGAVELAVKGDFAALLGDIEAGGGPALTRAFDAAGVPGTDRPARLLQMQGDLGLYQTNPGALTTALLLWGG
ncbi:hypothetical protein [Limimaricola pyoseonensis]|uniref:Uncharacterized protein n=1 Tax=Limimaricola pyoseonensis TaxID=521013 RepID=A0A1G7A248_9RHOB|nr:hypothetical protein [Limimaricola pyoseonensis]SDE08869.1 hypothetical protein SAMN04488567_0780 [Limimaricola pyoseonensis]